MRYYLVSSTSLNTMYVKKDGKLSEKYGDAIVFEDRDECLRFEESLSFGTDMHMEY